MISFFNQVYIKKKPAVTDLFVRFLFNFFVHTPDKVGRFSTSFCVPSGKGLHHYNSILKYLFSSVKEIFSNRPLNIDNSYTIYRRNEYKFK